MALTLHHGDCLEVMKSIPDKSVDLIICDLPYGCLTGGGGKEKQKRKDANSEDHIAGCAWDIKIDLDKFWKEVKRVRKSDRSPTIHFCTTKFGIDLINSNPDEFRYELVWNKERGVSFLLANKMPMRSHEMIYIFSKSAAYYKRIDVEGDYKRSGGGRSPANFISTAHLPNTSNVDNSGRRCPKSVISLGAKTLVKGGHPTEKPLDLYKFLIERYCPIDGTVLDPTFGSGNSVFCAYSLGLNSIGIEKDDAYFKKAEQRLEAL